jgi:glycosyltransferase involved in cell wall biosynthesis
MTNLRSRRSLLAVNPTGLSSGAELALRRLLCSARQAGWAVEAAVPRGALQDTLVADGIPVIVIPELKVGTAPRAIAMSIAAMRWLRAAPVLRRAAARVDLVLVNGLLALPAIRLAHIRQPVVWFVHDVIVRRDRLTLLRACQGAVTLAVAPSNAVTGPLTGRPFAVRVVRNGTPWPVEPAAVVPPEPPVIGMAALLTPWKGQNVLLDAASVLPRRDVVVELMGDTPPSDGAYERMLRERANRPDLAGRVRFLGYEDEPRARMRRWAVAVSASVDPEAAPLGVLEAMSIGLPVIATEHGGAPEVLGAAGLLVPPGDVRALADALGELIFDAKSRRRCAEAGPKLIARALTLDRNQRELLAVLDAVLDEAAVARA